MAKTAEDELVFTPPRELLDGHRTISHQVFCGVVKALDFLAIIAAGQAAFVAYAIVILGDAHDYGRYTLLSLLTASLFVLGLQRIGGYTIPRLAQIRWQMSRGLLVLAATISALTTAAFVTKLAAFYSRGWAIAWVAAMLCELGLMRVATAWLIRRWGRAGLLSRLVAVVGAGDIGEKVIAKFNAFGAMQIIVAGVFDDRLARSPSSIGGHRVIGTIDDLIKLARTVPLDEIVIALPFTAAERIGAIVTKLRSLPVDLRVCIDPVADTFPVQRISDTASVRVIEILDRPLKHWSGVIKRIEDLVLCVLCLVVLAPVMVLIAVAIRLDSRGPILFRQDRFGYASRAFHVWKFRTMHIEAGDPRGALRTVPADPRVTRVGRYLRRWSLDELPQLFNVLKGDMSIVGPRAHAVAMRVGERLYHDAVAEYLRRHRVRPGITGWAQVNGLRGEIDTVEKGRQRVLFDLYYIDNWSLWFDLYILARTILTVLSGRNAY